MSSVLGSTSLTKYTGEITMQHEYIMIVAFAAVVIALIAGFAAMLS
jgi:hypothetical protein